MNALNFERKAFNFEKRTLAKDTLSAISEFCTDKRFIGHDGREYLIDRGYEEAETKNVVEVAVKIEGSDKTLARYALLLIDIS